MAPVVWRLLAGGLPDHLDSIVSSPGADRQGPRRDDQPTRTRL